MLPQINMYSTSVTPKQKKNLLAMYEDYLYFSRGLEMIAQKFSTLEMATHQILQMYGSPKIDFPWHIEYANKYECRAYENFVNENFDKQQHYAYISLNHTDPQKDVKLPKIFYIPDEYDVSNIDVELPSPVERYSAAFPKEQTLGESLFVIDGKFKAVYKAEKNAQMPVAEALTERKTLIEFRMLLNLVKFFDEQPYLTEKEYVRTFMNIIASEGLATYENMVLESINSLSDKSYEICRSIYGGRSHDDFLKQAEKDGFIPSAARLQDFLNIRHLMRHQLDTLDSLGKFKPEEAEKNDMLRRKYLQSYRDLCDKSVMGRIKSYGEAGNFFRSELQALYPNYMWRAASESNSHFISRVKAFRHENPEMPLLLEINVPLLSDKRKPLLNSISKVTDNVRVIDDIQVLDDKFTSLEADYHQRKYFLRAYNTLECQMMSLCLANGQNCGSKGAWEFICRHKLISANDYEKRWKPWRQLRNELSHNHFDADLRQRLNAICEDFEKAVCEMEIKINAAMPQWKRVGEKVYQTTGGSKVKIDFKAHQIEKKQPLGKQSNGVTRERPNNKKVYTEEYKNGVSISSAGTEIVSCRLPNQLEIDLRKQRISYPDGVRLFMEAENFNVLQAGNAKVFTGKDFKVSKFMENNRRLDLSRNDMRILGRSCKISTDGYGRLQKINYKTGTPGAITLNIVVLKEGGVTMNFSDGTKLEINKNRQYKISHAGMELTFANRQKFATGYGGGGMTPPSNGGYGS